MIFVLAILLSAAVHSTTQTPVESTTLPSSCDEVGDCVTYCNHKCGCERAYYYNETSDECVVNKTMLSSTIIEKYNNQEKIRIEADNIFRGISISMIFIVCCASVCALSACIYCCHVNYSDHKLSAEVDACTKKLGRDKLRKSTKKVDPAKQASESCNIVVADAGVFVC